MINTVRQSGIIPDEAVRAASASIIGAGAIGSHTAEALCKMGVPSMKIWDFDIVEEHNLANQGFFIQDLGKFKAPALAERLSAGTGAEVVAYNERLEKDCQFDTEFVISAVDSMASRLVIWENYLDSPRSTYFLDGRMGARFGQVYFVDKQKPETIELYKNSLFSDEEAYTVPCTEKATIFCAYGIGSVICALVAKTLIKDDIRYVVEVDFANMFMNKCA